MIGKVKAMAPIPAKAASAKTPFRVPSWVGRFALMVPLSFAGTVAALDCVAPAGPRAILECEAARLGFQGGAELWSKKLFHTLTLDGFCRKPLPDGSNKVETEMYGLSCPTQPGSYFSYESFVNADEELKARLGDAYQFMRVGSNAVRLQEFANFLATAAQETGGNGLLTTKYEQDGLYFRYEVGAPLQRCFQPVANPGYLDANVDRTELPADQCATKTLAQFVTTYYPLSTYVVAVQDGTGLVDTEFVSDNDCQYGLTSPKAAFRCWDGQSMKPTIIGGKYPPPAGYSWQFMNQVLPPGDWIGMGNLQLTGDAMIKFFGWYHQNLLSVRQKNADPKSFVKNFLVDAKLAWTGGLWYWNFRTNGMVGSTGEPKPTLHDVLTGTKDACHDIGITTVLVNGTQCHDVEGRSSYYNYFKTQVFKLPGDAVLFTYGGSTFGSMACNEQILAYCTQ